ncbi:MAG TPA: penicillin acylase family protein [Candidatus Dormibacteraeota bacterium]
MPRLMRRLGMAALLTVALLLLPGSLPAGAAGCASVRGPVGDAFPDCSPTGTVRNVLPPGATGGTSVVQFASGQPAPHSRDQLAMYADLVKVAPNLAAAQLAAYYKSSGFGVAPADVERMETPHGGTVILRDKQSGTPHIFGATRYDTEFGAGYAAAEDRLFLMDVFRHLGRSQLSAFLGPSASTLALDCSVARVAGYSEQDLQAQVDKARTELSQPFAGGLTEGQQVYADATAYSDGVNQYIQEALADPNKLPAEYPALQEAPVPWKLTDIVAIATLVQAIFASPPAAATRSTRRFCTAP